MLKTSCQVPGHFLPQMPSLPISLWQADGHRFKIMSGVCLVVWLSPFQKSGNSWLHKPIFQVCRVPSPSFLTWETAHGRPNLAHNTYANFFLRLGRQVELLCAFLLKCHWKISATCPRLFIFFNILVYGLIIAPGWIQSHSFTSNAGEKGWNSTNPYKAVVKDKLIYTSIANTLWIDCRYRQEQVIYNSIIHKLKIFFQDFTGNDIQEYSKYIMETLGVVKTSSHDVYLHASMQCH